METTETTVKAAADLSRAQRGTSQSGARLYNERLVLSLIRSHGSLPKAEIARLTRLSPQTVSVIVRQLEADNLVLKGISIKGKIGQPLQPYSLNPEGAFSIGIKVGRRSCNVICLDLTGQVRARYTEVYDYPAPADVINVTRKALQRIKSVLGPQHSKRVVGVGIAAPFELWNWEQEVGAPAALMEQWRGVDIVAHIQSITDWPISHCNDATAACAAELFFGVGKTYRDHAYFYVGFFIGGGIVLNGMLFPGRTGYAGAMGPLLVPRGNGTEQLIRHASIYVLEKAMTEQGRDPLQLTRNPDDWSFVGPILDDWIDNTARSLAQAAISAASIIDFEAVIIDGALPPNVRARITEATRIHFFSLDHRGIAPLQIVEGSLGTDARALGAASLPLFANYMIDRDVLFKETT